MFPADVLHQSFRDFSVTFYHRGARVVCLFVIIWTIPRQVNKNLIEGAPETVRCKHEVRVGFVRLMLSTRARKIFSVPVAEMSQVPFFWSHFLSSWSQSCAKTQKFRRKKRSYIWGHLLHTPGHEHHQWNDRKRKEKKKKLQERSWAHFISHETLRGRGRSCWIKADKKFANRSKRETWKEKCAYMCEQTWHHHGRLKQFWLQQCTMLESAVLTWPWACCALQLHFTCSATLFLSFEVRACCDSAVDFTSKKVVSVVVILKSKSPVISTCLSKESALAAALGCLSTSRLLEESSLHRVTVADCALAHELHRLAESNFRFVPQPVAQTQCPSTSRRPSLKSPCRFQSCPAQELFFNVRNRAFPGRIRFVPKSRTRSDGSGRVGRSIWRFCRFCLTQNRWSSAPTDVRLHVGSSTEVVTATGQVPHDEACRSLRTPTVFGRLPTAGTSKIWWDSRRSSFVQVGNEGRFWFLFSESGREECSSGRSDAPGPRVLGAKLRLHQVFWSQNLAFQSQKCDCAPGRSSENLKLNIVWKTTKGRDTQCDKTKWFFLLIVTALLRMRLHVSG